MWRLRHASDFFRVEHDSLRRRVLVTRSPRLFISEAEVQETCRPVLDALDSIDRATHGLLLDSRAAMGVNEPEYESWYEPFGRRMVADFARVAVVVRTATGQLQASRLNSHDRIRRIVVVTSMAEAEAWIAGF